MLKLRKSRNNFVRQTRNNWNYHGINGGYKEVKLWYYRHWRSTETKRDVQTIFAFSQKNAENENANFP